MREFFTSKVMRRIVTLMLLTEFLWGLGIFFVLPTTTITAYLTELKSSPMLIAALGISMSSLSLFPQLFGRMVIERFRRRKRAVILFHLLFALPYLVIPLLHQQLMPGKPTLLAWLVIALLAISQLALGLVAPVWMDMLGQVIPLPLRGRYFGMSALFFAGGGILGGLGVSLLLAQLGKFAFQGSFLVAGAFFIFSMCAFSLAPVSDAALSHPPGPPLLLRLRQSIAACHPRTNFGRLVLSFAVQALAASVVPFLMVYALDKRHGLGYDGKSIIGLVTCVQALGSACGGLVLGTLVDRIGPRIPWVIATALIPLVVFLMPYGHSAFILLFAFLLAGVLNTPWSVTGPAMLELSPDGDKSGYIAMANVIGFLPTTVGYLLMGFLVGQYGYHAAFIAAGAFGIIAFLIGLTLRRRVTPQRRRRAVVVGSA